MEVYIVTSGSYSDYGIRKVFLNKEKAERYAQLSQDGYDEYEVEVWDASDELEIRELKYINVSYTLDGDYPFFSDEDYRFKVVTTNSIDTADEYLSRTSCYHDYRGNYHINIYRPIQGWFSEVALKAKYLNTCRDIMAQIQSLKSIELWTVKMIQAWFNSKVSELLPKFEGETPLL